MGIQSIRGDIGPLRGDVGLLREAISLIDEFGLRSTERLAFVANFLERSVYLPNSLRVVPDGVGFTLLNPPLRVGAFSAVRVAWDGAFLPPDAAFVQGEGHAVERPLSDISPSRTIDLRPGQRLEVRLSGISADPAEHRIRLELQNIAVPPLVWFEFVDTIRQTALP